MNDGNSTTATTVTVSRGTSPLSDSQEKTLALLPIIPCILSISGALVIIYRILWREQEKRRTPYQRILLGMSVMGMLAVGSFLMQPFLLPQNSSHRVWASGNDASCAFSGFMFQLSISMVFYYSSLSFYFLAVVRFGLSDRKFSQQFEPWMHAITIGFPLVTASIGAALGVYAEHDLSPLCWVSNYPRGCEEDPNVSCRSPLIGWIFGGGVMVLSLVTILVNNILIFCHVSKEANLPNATSFAQVQQQYQQNGNNSHPRPDGMVATTTTTRQQRNPKVRAVAIQGAMYVATGIICYLPTVMLRAIEATQSDELGGSPEGRLFPVFVLQAIFLPSQNSIITLIFLQPRYAMCRTMCPNKSRLWALQYAVMGGNIQRTTFGNSTTTQAQDRSRLWALQYAVTGGNISRTTFGNSTTTQVTSVAHTQTVEKSHEASATQGFDLSHPYEKRQNGDEGDDKESVTQRTLDDDVA